MDLQQWLSREGITDAAFAKVVDCDQTTINRTRRGRTLPSFALIQRIERATRNEVRAADLMAARMAGQSDAPSSSDADVSQAAAHVVAERADGCVGA